MAKEGSKRCISDGLQFALLIAGDILARVRIRCPRALDVELTGEPNVFYARANPDPVPARFDLPAIRRDVLIQNFYF